MVRRRRSIDCEEWWVGLDKRRGWFWWFSSIEIEDYWIGLLCRGCDLNVGGDELCDECGLWWGPVVAMWNMISHGDVLLHLFNYLCWCSFCTIHGIQIRLEQHYPTLVDI